MTLQRRQGGPWPPPPCGVNSLGKLFWSMSGCCFGSSGFLSGLCEAVVISQGSVFVFGPLSPSRPDPCLLFNNLSSSFFSLSGTVDDAVSLSLSLSLFIALSLSGAGETQAFLVWVSLVFSRPRSPSTTCTSRTTPTSRFPPAPVFFLDVARLSGGCWWWFVVFDLDLSLSLSRWFGSLG